MTLPKVSHLASGIAYEEGNALWVEDAKTTMIAPQLLLPADVGIDIRAEESTETTPP